MSSRVGEKNYLHPEAMLINALAQRSSLEQEAGNGRPENPKTAHNGGDDEAHRFLNARSNLAAS